MDAVSLLCFEMLSERAKHTPLISCFLQWKDFQMEANLLSALITFDEDSETAFHILTSNLILYVY